MRSLHGNRCKAHRGKGCTCGAYPVAAPAGFQVVPVRESNVPHVYAPRRMPRAQREFLAARCDPMALQAALILRAVLREFRNPA